MPQVPVQLVSSIPVRAAGSAECFRQATATVDGALRSVTGTASDPEAVREMKLRRDKVCLHRHSECGVLEQALLSQCVG